MDNPPYTKWYCKLWLYKVRFIVIGQLSGLTRIVYCITCLIFFFKNYTFDHFSLFKCLFKLLSDDEGCTYVLSLYCPGVFPCVCQNVPFYKMTHNSCYETLAFFISFDYIVMYFLDGFLSQI